MQVMQLAELLFTSAIPLIFAMTVHEVAHGWVSYKFGDPTAKMMGRLTLNPIPHVDLVGTILLPLGLLVLSWATGGFMPIIGWAKPVPVDARYYRNNWRAKLAMVSVAGPLSNLIQAAIWVILFKVAFMSGFTESTTLLHMIQNGVMYNLMLMAFNLIPVPPLDGGHFLENIMPLQWASVYGQLERYGFLIVMLLLMSGVASYVVWPIYQAGEAILNLLL